MSMNALHGRCLYYPVGPLSLDLGGMPTESRITELGIPVLGWRPITVTVSLNFWADLTCGEDTMHLKAVVRPGYTMPACRPSLDLLNFHSALQGKH